MSIDAILYIVLIVLVLYIIVLPLSKSRAVIFRGKTGFAVTVVLIATIPYIGPVSYALATICGVVLVAVRTRIWLVAGISPGKIKDALVRSANMTRTELEDKESYFTLDHDSSVRVIQITKHSSAVLFRLENDSKKSILAKKVFKKFIENYKIGV